MLKKHIIFSHLIFTLTPDAEQINDLFICGTGNIMEEPTTNKNFYKEFSMQILKLPKEGLILFFSFLLFLNLSMFSIKDRLQTL